MGKGDKVRVPERIAEFQVKNNIGPFFVVLKSVLGRIEGEKTAEHSKDPDIAEPADQPYINCRASLYEKCIQPF
jgi:hypothetical protein